MHLKKAGLFNFQVTISALQLFLLLKPFITTALEYKAVLKS